MTEPPRDAAQIQHGTDIEVDPENLGTDDPPATSDPEAFTDDSRLGGVGGDSPGGAG